MFREFFFSTNFFSNDYFFPQESTQPVGKQTENRTRSVVNKNLLNNVDFYSSYKNMMNNRSKLLTKEDCYCQLCSIPSSNKPNKRLSSFFCDHCHLSLCYQCFEEHSKTSTKNETSNQTNFSSIEDLFDKKTTIIKYF